METSRLNAVTGALGYTGKYITRRLLSLGERVHNLTGHLNREDPFDSGVRTFLFNFERPADLKNSLQGVSTLFNTYWIRFPQHRLAAQEVPRFCRFRHGRLPAAARLRGGRGRTGR